MLWYEPTPTIISTDEETVYINCQDEHFPKDVESQKYVREGKGKDEPIVILKRKHIARLLEDVSPEDIVASGISPETLAVGTDEEAAKVAPFEDVEKARKLADEKPKKLNDEKTKAE